MTNPGPGDKPPPSNVDAERGVIGACLLENEFLDDVVRVLKPGDFFRAKHETVWEAVLGLYRAGTPVDATILAAELTRLGKYRELGGEEFLRELVDGCPNAANAVYYAQIVRQKAIARELLEAYNEGLREVYSDNFTAEQLAAAAERRVFAVGEGRAAERLGRAGAAAARSVEQLEARETSMTGVETGLMGYDDLTDGLQPGDLIVVGARPSMGKTALALCVANYVAVDCKRTVLFASAEMGQVQLADRLLSIRSGVSSRTIRRPKDAITDRDRDLLSVAFHEISAAPLYFDDTPGLSLSHVVSASRRLRRREGLALVIVDYMQLLEVENPDAPRQEQIALLSRRLKALARDLNVPVVALSQLNRALETRQDKRPRMADLRESGQVEQDADVVALLHLPAKYDPNAPPGVAELIVDKNRNGETKILTLAADGPTYRFTDFAGVV